jgi:glycosyltransferase involved in cell wall biosynthesis
VIQLNNVDKLFIIKFGDPVEEFKSYAKRNKNDEDVYSPMWDYIPQFYKECEDILKNCRVYWMGVGGQQKKILICKDSWFITYRHFLKIRIFYLLFKVNPDLIINIAGQYPLVSLYLFKLIKKNTKILQFIAGESPNNLFSIFFRSLLKMSDKIYVMNSQTQKKLEKEIKKNVDIFVPLYTKEFLETNKKIPCIRENKLNIFYCGRFSTIKGIWDLFQIIKKIKNENIVFHLIGKGYEYKLFKQKINENGLDNLVRFYGFVPNFLLYNYLRQADIGIIPSKSEGYCQVAEEFLISNIPIIATKVGGLIDQIEDGKNGYLIDEENKIEKFIEKINYLYNNPEEIKQMKQNIIPAKYFNRENVFGKIVKNYYLEQIKIKK